MTLHCLQDKDVPLYPVSAFADASRESPLRQHIHGSHHSTPGGVQRVTPKLTVARVLSGIPTDINVPELVFGRSYRASEDNMQDPILPFSVYAPCRILDVSPDGKVIRLSNQLCV